MDLALRTETGSVLKPVMNAAQRSLNHGRVETSASGVRIWGNNPANITVIDIDLGAAAFESYDFDGEAFETSFEKLWDAFREGKKGDSYALRLENPEYEELDDLWSLGSADIRVLEDNGITTPAQLRDASREEIVGTATYSYEDHRGEEKERTAEIEEEDVFDIRRDFDPIVVVEINGEEPLDEWDHPRKYPRARPPERDFQKPDLDTTAHVAINARDFSKAFRAVETVSDAVFLGATEGEFVVYGEGDTDEVHATPDAEIDGVDAGGMYSTDYIRDLRLSIDRRASTELLLRLPAIAGHEDRPHLLGAEFTIEKSGEGEAVIEYQQAPKIMAAGRDEDDTENESQLLSRISPSNYTPLGAAKLRATTSGGTAKDWFGILGAVSDECRIHVRENELHTRLVDPANVQMLGVTLPREAWENYRYRSPQGILGNNDGELGLPTHRVNDFLKLFTKSDEVTFEIDNSAHLSISGPNFTAVLPTIDPDSVRMSPDLPPLELPGRSEVDPEEYIDVVGEMDDISDHVHLMAYQGQLAFWTENDMESQFSALETADGVGYGHSIFSLEYFSDFFRPHPGEGTLEVYLGREFPVAHFMEIHGADLSMMLAPRILSERNPLVEAGDDLGNAIAEAGWDYERIENASPRFKLNTENADSIMVDDPDEEPLDPDEGPKEVAERVREEMDEEVPGDGEKPYDPTDDWDPQAIAERVDAHKREMQPREVPIDPEEMRGTFGTIRTTEGELVRAEDATKEHEEEAWLEMMDDIYGDSFDPGDTRFKGVGGGRRMVLESIEHKDRLHPIENPEQLDDILDGIREISLDGYMSPPEDPIETIERVHDGLPDEAKPHYVQDETLLRRINAARRQFNTWKGRKQREAQIPSPVEAGPANYPTKKAQKTSQYERDAHEELREKIGNISSGARGGRQRALRVIGSSVAEQTEQAAQETRENRRERWNVGDVIIHTQPGRGWRPWGIKRLNKKSVRLKRPDPRAGQSKPMSDDTYDDYQHTTVEYDSDWIKRVPRDEVGRLGDAFADIPEGNHGEFETFDTYEETIRHLMGEEWVTDRLDLDAESEAEPDAEGEPPENVAGWELESVEDTAVVWTRPDAGDSQNADVELWEMRVSKVPSAQTDRMETVYRVSTSLHGTSQIDPTADFISRSVHQEGGFSRDRDKAVERAINEMEKKPYAAAEDPEPVEDDESGISKDVEESLVALGINRISAQHLAQDHNSVDELREVLEKTADPTQLAGITERTEQEVLEALALTEAEPDVEPVEGWYGDLDVVEGIADGRPLLTDEVNQTAVELPREIGAFELVEPSTEDTVAEYTNGTVLRLIEDGDRYQAAHFEHATERPTSLLTDPTDVTEAFEALEARARALTGQPGLGDVDLPELPEPDEPDDRTAPITDLPEHVSGFDLAHDDPIIWHGQDVPGAPAILPRDEPSGAEVQVEDSRAFVVWTGDGPEGVPDGVLDTEDIVWADTDEEAIEAAVEWMQSHPAGQRERLDPDTDPEELPWYARRYLSGAWGRYKGALSKGHDAREAVEEYAEIRREGKEAAAEINEVRRQYGQEPIDFEGVPAIGEIDGVEGELVPEEIDHDFEWDRSKPYDPTEDVKGVMA